MLCNCIILIFSYDDSVFVYTTPCAAESEVFGFVSSVAHQYGECRSL